VNVLNFPCEEKDEHRDDLDTMLITGLPLGAMHLRCEWLKVRSYQKKERDPRDPNKVIEKSYQEMEAHGRVTAQGKEFFAQCDHMTFNEEKDQVIFIGDNGRPAVLERRFVKGGKPDVIHGRKITYIRSTGKASADEIDGIDVR
jgi:lipopolysaccharide export system protein LptA